MAYLPLLGLSSLLVLASLWLRVGAVDLTLQDDASGADIVQAVIAKLDSSHIFQSDHRLLRRIAYVESQDGTKGDAHGSFNGGIWAVDQSTFQALLTAPELTSIRDAIRQVFGIDWAHVTWNDLRKPFYSGLAARMFLSHLELSGTASIPLAGNVWDQAQFWFNYYKSINSANITVEHFELRVNILDKKEGCKVNTDLFFVLDGSGSIGSGNFDQVRQFEYDFVKEMDIGPNDNQVGTIIFSATAQMLFSLNTYQNKSDLLSAIQTITYPGDSTNTPDGLCKLVRYGFIEQNGARPTSAAIFRVAIVMTDGKSNRQSQECQWNTLQAAEAVHELRPPVLVYAIGVTSSVNDEELQAIASSPSYVTYLTSFNRDILQEAQEEHSYKVCKTASVPADTGGEMNGTLDEDESVRYHFQIPVAGITLDVCVSSGRVIVYGSVSVPNPNSAFYDWMVEVEYDNTDHSTEQCDNIFFDPDKIPTKAPPTAPPPISQSHRAAISPTTSSQHGSPATGTSTHSSLSVSPTTLPSSGAPTDPSVKMTNITVYLSVVGKHKENHFALNSTVGDVYGEDDVTPSPTPEDTNADEVLLFITLSSSGAALLAFVLCILIPCCVCGCFMRGSKKDYRRVSTKEDMHKLIPVNGDSV